MSALEPALLEGLSRCCSVRGILMRILVEMLRPGIGVWHAENFGERASLLRRCDWIHTLRCNLRLVRDAAPWRDWRLGSTRCCSTSSASGRTGGALRRFHRTPYS